ncbi:hypothetical protein JTE90_000966 [Oedothorax gibbosus]|uniref:Uncharacterized protein n=1 Tax=Oedothorax gibbosus TaxID=931172 RepID=A0AAV6VDR7_9ARAC|nr:hypothetical protein JTE90_000966 [Oedothorax gibbosus]
MGDRGIPEAPNSWFRPGVGRGEGADICQSEMTFLPAKFGGLGKFGASKIWLGSPVYLAMFDKVREGVW